MVRLTDHLDMTIVVDCDVKQTKQTYIVLDITRSCYDSQKNSDSTKIMALKNLLTKTA